MPLYVKDDKTIVLVAHPARQRGLSKEEAAKRTVRAEQHRAAPVTQLRDRFATLRAAYPLPPVSSLAANKAFFDDLSAE